MADYAISNVPRRVVYANTGVGPYAFTFEILANTDIAVYRGSTLLTLTTDYTVTIDSNGTGSVTLVTAGTGNITIVGARAIQRTSDYTTGGDLFASTLNTDLDSQTIYVQQVAETAERGLKAPVVDPTDINMTLPSKTDRAGTFLAFDSPSGNPIAGPSIASVGTVTQNIANINTVATNIASVNTVAGNISNVNTVAGISGNVTTVANNNANITTVADDLNEPVSEINTVATNITNVNTVGNNITNVNTVAGISANVTSVAGNATNINTVAGSIANVNALGPIAADITTVAGIDSDVTAVAADATDIGTVAGNIANVNTVAGISANVTSVAGNSTNINTVAGISSNVTTVATNNANVTTVAGSIANVNTNATNIANINQNAANIVAIQNASANATAAANSATAAASSATSASASAASASAVALGNEPVRHSVRPSLLLDFANTKTLDPRITFTRASTATFYDGKTVAKAEENLFTYSEQFNNAIWATGASISANTSVAPDGNTTADTYTRTSTGEQRLRYTTTQANSTAYTVSVYAKAGTANFLRLRNVATFTTGTTDTAWFNLSTGAVATVGANVTATITSVGNSWYRCSITGTTVASIGANNLVDIASATSDAEVSSGTSGETIYLWGAQLEQRSSVTAYTATTSAQITNYIPALQTAASGVARFEHNPVTGESLGLEIEEQRTNLLLRSEEYDNASWTKANANITTNTVVAPDGMLTADAMVETTASAQHYVLQTATATLTSALTLSVYAKLAYGSRYLGFTLANQAATTNGVRAIFNLSSGAVLLTQNLGNGTGASTSITHVGNGWYRCTLSGIPDTSGTTARVIISLSDSSAAPTPSYAGDGWSALYIWGAQLEAGSFATSYIPTVASQVTRNADSASMTGTNFSSWFRADEGTLYADFLSGNDTLATRIFEITDSTGANRSAIIGSTGGGAGPYFWVASGNATQASTTAGTFTANTAYKVSGTYKVNDFAASINAGTVLTDSSGLVPNIPDRAYFGTDATNYMNGTIKKLAYYPKRLTNAELQGLTTV